MSVAKKDYKRITTKSIDMKANGEKMLTAYDYTMAKNCGWY
jgi:hypothetical protein